MAVYMITEEGTSSLCLRVPVERSDAFDCAGLSSHSPPWKAVCIGCPPIAGGRSGGGFFRRGYFFVDVRVALLLKSRKAGMFVPDARMPEVVWVVVALVESDARYWVCAVSRFSAVSFRVMRCAGLQHKLDDTKPL